MEKANSMTDKGQNIAEKGSAEKGSAEKDGGEKGGSEKGGSEKGTGSAAPPALTALLNKNFPDSVLEHHAQHGDETVVIRREGMLDVFRFLRDNSRCKFDLMIDLTAVDRLPRTPRFELVVHLKSIQLHHRLRVRIPLEESAAEVDSIQPLWVAAEWYERECWEMYGIDFKGHPELEHLLLYEGFQGHPLRKDYEKEVMQPLVPMRPVRERHDYGEVFRFPEQAAPAAEEEESA